MSDVLGGVPVTVLTGFLGSGKTTLLNWVLHAEHGYKLAVIVNEFGEISVDGSSVSGGEQFVELDNGCLCCAINEDFEQTLRDLAERGGFDHLVLETTGLADPLPVAWTFARPGISEAYRLDAIVTVVDALNFTDVALPAVKPEAVEARMQVARADVVIMNKMDLVNGDAGPATAAVRDINKLAAIIEGTQAQVSWDIVLCSTQPTRTAAMPEDPDYHHHSSFETVSFDVAGEVAEQTLQEVLNDLPASVYRVKGILQTDAEWDWTLVNGVASRIDLRPVTPRKAARPSLVFIGKNLDRGRLEAACRRLTGQG